ncbi:MAG: ABC transporter permease [Opitutaceae bacterium]|nr:ABC transporter permease [Verrucomicrobiales bacterium]
MTAMAATSDKPRTTNAVVRWFLSEYLVLVLTILLIVVLAPFTPGLLTPANLLNILGYLLPLFIIAIGMTMVMITGGIDLSVTSVIALTSVVGATLMTSDGHSLPVVAGVLTMLALGAGIGAINGAIVTWLRLPAFIVTLASMMFLSGFAVWYTQSKSIYNLPASFLSLGQRLPITLAVTGFLAVVAHLLLRRTVYGRWLYAVGQNATAAHISGVPVRAVICAAYIASGFCAALASIMLTARLETGSPVLGREILLDVIGATVVGGTSLFGGRGKIAWTFFGVLFLTVLDNALNLLNLSQFSITIAKGCVILLAAVLDAVRSRFVVRGG